MRKRPASHQIVPGAHDPQGFAGEIQYSLQVIANRPQPGQPWRDAVNLPWDDPVFSVRMLAEQLDQSHGAGSRRFAEIDEQVAVLWEWLQLTEGARVLDVTCGPGSYAQRLAARGCNVVGIDVSPAAIVYARAEAQAAGLAARLHYQQADVRTVLPTLPAATFDAALFLYGQASVFTPAETGALFGACARALRPGGRLAVELLDYDRIDKKPHTWWFTGHGGLWGDFEHLHLGEREWHDTEQAVLERFYVINLETGALQTYGITDQAYPSVVMHEKLGAAGFRQVVDLPAWGGQVSLYDASEWIVYLAQT